MLLGKFVIPEEKNHGFRIDPGGHDLIFEAQVPEGGLRRGVLEDNANPTVMRTNNRSRIDPSFGYRVPDKEKPSVLPESAYGVTRRFVRVPQMHQQHRNQDHNDQHCGELHPSEHLGPIAQPRLDCIGTLQLSPVISVEGFKSGRASNRRDRRLEVAIKCTVDTGTILSRAPSGASDVMIHADPHRQIQGQSAIQVQDP